MTFTRNDAERAGDTAVPRVNRRSGKVLAASGGNLADGADLVQWTEAGAADQAWHTTTSNGRTALGNRSSGRVVGVYSAGTADGERTVQGLDTGAADQQWEIVQVS